MEEDAAGPQASIANQSQLWLTPEFWSFTEQSTPAFSRGGLHPRGGPRPPRVEQECRLNICAARPKMTDWSVI